jgi:hypothetical protein
MHCLMSLSSRCWFCALSGSVRGRISELALSKGARIVCPPFTLMSLCDGVGQRPNSVPQEKDGRVGGNRGALSLMGQEGAPISSFSRSSMIVPVGPMSIEPHALARLKSE